MDLEKELRESVQTVSRRSVQDVRFTPELEQRILKQLQERRKRSYRRLSAAVAAVACLAVGVFAWTQGPVELREHFRHLATALSEKKDQALVQKALAPLLQAIPELDSYASEIEETSAYAIHVQLRQNDRVAASAAINRESGEVEAFKWFVEDSAEGLPAEQLAKERAAAFLQELLGTSYEQYELVAAGEIQRPRHGYLELDAEGFNVVYRQTQNGETIPFTDHSVWVDGAGRVVSYSHLNEAEQATLAKLQRILPELNSAAVLANKETSPSGASLALADADAQGNMALVSTEGKGDVLRAYEIEYVGEPNTESAPKSLAVEKANQFLQEVLGDDSKNYRESGIFLAPRFMRYHNELPVLEDYIDVNVDGEGRIVRYRKNVGTYDLAALPDPAKAVSRKTAEEAVAENMKLRYFVSEDQPMLDYTPAVADLQTGAVRSLYWYVDAVTGKMQYGYGNNGIDYDRQASHESIRLASRDSDQSIVIRTKEEAASLLANEWGWDLDGLEFSESEETRGATGGKQIAFRWETEEEKRLEIIADARTGQVVSLTIPRADSNSTVSREDALQEALRFLGMYAGPGVEEVQIARTLEPGDATPVSSGNWLFAFFKSHEGIPVIGQTTNEAFRVEVDPATGKVNGFLDRTDWQEDHALPDKNKAVPVEKAVQEYLAYLPLQLAYTLEGAEGEQIAEPKLIYVPMSDPTYAHKFIHIDAITGEAVIW